ncbi:MAG: TIGR03905 family TSCPD domain-containing protein [Ruminococcaceae bacterium]|nr:TIGR03905 family TSCPD domain-containing protein [Oscillospiraceae bacterium]
MKYSFRTRGVCARNISFELEDGIVKDVSFMGGCNGNLKAISKLINGMEAQKVIDILRGNDCGGRGTSCADQLAIALEEAMKAGNN